MGSKCESQITRNERADDADDNDLAMAVVNLVCQTVGMIAAGAAGATGKDTIVIIGKLAAFPAAAGVFELLSKNDFISELEA